MTSNPLETLLAVNNSKTQAAQDLSQAHQELTRALENYKLVFATACKNGWAKKDLLRAGFADPAKLRLPREKKTAANDTEAN